MSTVNHAVIVILLGAMFAVVAMALLNISLMSLVKAQVEDSNNAKKQIGNNIWSHITMFGIGMAIVGLGASGLVQMLQQ